jgi:hypothetical protein
MPIPYLIAHGRGWKCVRTVPADIRDALAGRKRWVKTFGAVAAGARSGERELPGTAAQCGSGWGTGTGKSHIAIGITRSCIRLGTKARFFNAVDLVNKLEARAKIGHTGRLGDRLTRVDLAVMERVERASEWRARRDRHEQRFLQLHRRLNIYLSKITDQK